MRERKITRASLKGEVQFIETSGVINKGICERSRPEPEMRGNGGGEKVRGAEQTIELMQGH